VNNYTLDNKFLLTICFWGNSSHFLLISRRWAQICKLKLKTMRMKANWPQVLLSRRRLLNHTSPTSSAPRPHILTQDELNNLVRDLELSKSKAELLGSRLKQWNLLEKNVQISSFRSHHQHLVPFFRKEDDLVLCYDVDGLMNTLGIKHDLQEWRLFIDSSKLCTYF